MKEFLTVDKALKKGHQVLTIPVFLIILLTLILIFGLVAYEKLPNYFIALSMPVSIGLALLYWSRATVKWRIWAFKNTRNVNELKKRAIEQDLMQEENYILQRLERWNKLDFEEWEEISKKFNQVDIFIDDSSVPDESLINNSKLKLGLNLSSYLFCFTFGLFTIMKTNQEIFGIILCLIGVYFTFVSIRRYKNKENQFVISDAGIKIYNSEMIRWNEITKEEIKTENRRSTRKNYFCFNHTKGQEKIDISQLNITRWKLSKLIILYRQRNITKRIK